MGKRVAAIVAGGRATRLGGVVKPLIEYRGVTILDRQLAALEGLAASLEADGAPGLDRVVLSVNQAEAFADRDLPIVADGVSGAGPLAGVAAVLEATGASWMLAIAGDMPLVSAEVLRALWDRMTDEVDLVTPRVGGFLEPLLAGYSARCLPAIAERLAGGRRRLSALAEDPSLRVAELAERELRAVDPELRSLININRLSDLRG